MDYSLKILKLYLDSEQRALAIAERNILNEREILFTENERINHLHSKSLSVSRIADITETINRLEFLMKHPEAKVETDTKFP